MKAIIPFAILALAFTAAPDAKAQATDCSEIEFTSQILSEYPNAPEFCHDVAARDGKLYAHFILEYQRASGGTVYAKPKRPDGSTGDTVAFSPPSDSRVQIDGRQYRYSQLSRGQELDVWVPHDRWAFAPAETEEDLMAETAVTVIVIEEVIEEDEMMAQSLPSTATNMPLVGILGAVFIVIGTAIGWLRRRWLLSR
jgi:hypothetical protein